ncbi:MAG: proliferating cell nuclear antigen (pcna) [Candidatus Nezhaarchaeota archaeon]|nr:proliferating cell nuclear antigen (pcna) [Candidatus Nezhaarchaeota archaeon]MCX8141881.1 proliferating cell nuclear antigen (pcna) [Candidatus Nezhaarchaeota archaeon]MDW8050338.1 proliferating cell nuclear antigen (pcna) [Nitrososphaerota archaeon]
MFRATFRDARLWYGIIDALSSLIEEGIIKVNESGVRLRAMDPSKIAMIDFEMPKDAFEEYECDGEMIIGINFDELKKVAKRGGAKEKVQLEVPPGSTRFKITLKGKAMRSFSIPLMDIEYEELPTPSLTYNVKATIMADVFEDALKDVELVSDYVKLEGRSNVIIVRGQSDRGEVETELTVEAGALLDLEVKEESSASYSLEYLMDMVRANKAAEVATLEFSSAMPLSLTFPIPGGGTIRYFLAPRLEE